MSSQRPDLVTGATGFIGAHLVRRLVAEGRPVRVLCRPGSLGKLARIGAHLDVVPGTMTDPASLAAATKGAARVFHCAAEVSDWGTLEQFRAVNVRGTGHLLEAARAAGVERFVHVSSFVVFGLPPPREVEDALPYGTGKDPYTVTKIEAEHAVFASHARGLPAVVLRPTVVYGNGSTWLEEPIRMMKKGGFFLLGGGAGTCHGCYVENLVDALLLAGSHPRAVGQGYLVADDDPCAFRDYFAALARLAGVPEARRSVPLPAARALASTLEAVARLTRSASRPMLTHVAVDLVTTRFGLSMRKIREELGYAPRYTFRGAIARLGEERRAAGGAAE